MKWTKEKPMKSGWYWWRPKKNFVPHIAYVVWESVIHPVQKDRMFVLYPPFSVEFTVNERGGEWAGPIQEPEE